MKNKEELQKQIKDIKDNIKKLEEENDTTNIEETNDTNIGTREELLLDKIEEINDTNIEKIEELLLDKYDTMSLRQKDQYIYHIMEYILNKNYQILSEISPAIQELTESEESYVPNYAKIKLDNINITSQTYHFLDECIEDYNDLVHNYERVMTPHLNFLEELDEKVNIKPEKKIKAFDDLDIQF
jgi:hypothetical protein